MKIILLAIGVLVLAGCAVGLLLTYQALGNTESELDDAQADVANLQQELQDTRNSLVKTQDDLQDTAVELESTQSDLNEQKNETAEYIDLYESTQEELEDVEKELNTTSGLLNSIQQENEDLQEDMDEIQEKLDLYEDTLGITVYSNILPPYNYGYLADLTLTDNATAVNPTWVELKEFLFEDKTDKNLYVDDVYMCGSFAEELHNNAEAIGIRTAFVVIHFYNVDSHAVNAFKTVDQGLVYIDVTGDTVPIALSNLDKKVTLVKDGIYQGTLIFPQSGWTLPQSDWQVESIEIYW